jgi:hypothetical protein
MLTRISITVAGKTAIVLDSPAACLLTVDFSTVLRRCMCILSGGGVLTVILNFTNNFTSADRDHVLQNMYCFLVFEVRANAATK